MNSAVLFFFFFHKDTVPEWISPHLRVSRPHWEKETTTCFPKGSTLTTQCCLKKLSGTVQFLAEANPSKEWLNGRETKVHLLYWNHCNSSSPSDLWKVNSADQSTFSRKAGSRTTPLTWTVSNVYLTNRAISVFIWAPNCCQAHYVSDLNIPSSCSLIFLYWLPYSVICQSFLWNFVFTSV